jgi:hypothetical protein
VTDQSGVPQIKRFDNGRKIIGITIHVISRGGLA